MFSITNFGGIRAMNRYMKGLTRIPVYLVFLFLILLTLASGCGRNTNQKEVDTPTSGTIKMGLDDSYSLLMSAEIYAFETFYRNAHIDTLCRNEADIIDAFKKDSIPLMVVNRKLTKAEEDNLKAQLIIVRTTRIAYDAVALIVNPSNPDTNILYGKIEGIFKGKVTQWKELDPASKLGDIRMVFDNYKSGNTRYFRELFKVDKLPGNCYALNNNKEVIEYVQKHPDAIGVVSVNWISDPADTVSHRFLTMVKVVGINREGTDGPDATFYTPHPGYVAEGFYPFIREVYMMSRQTYSGLAIGFTSYVAGPDGQLIVLHSGLVPATMPVRIVQINK